MSLYCQVLSALHLTHFWSTSLNVILILEYSIRCDNLNTWQEEMLREEICCWTVLMHLIKFAVASVASAAAHNLITLAESENVCWGGKSHMSRYWWLDWPLKLTWLLKETNCESTSCVSIWHSPPSLWNSQCRTSYSQMQSLQALIVVAITTLNVASLNCRDTLPYDTTQ